MDFLGIRKKHKSVRNKIKYNKALDILQLKTVPITITTSNICNETTMDFISKCLSKSIDIPIDGIWQKHESWGGNYIGAYDYWDALVLSGVVREKQIKKVIEISPNHGWSTLFMRFGNELESHISFDLEDHESSIKNKLSEYQALGNWHFVLGDVKKTIHSYIAQVKEADLIFIDSDHRLEFARWYVEDLKIFDLAKKGALIHIHDIYPKGKEPPIDCGESPYIIDFANKNKSKFNIMYNYEVSRMDSIHSKYPKKYFINHAGVQATNPSIWFEKI